MPPPRVFVGHLPKRLVPRPEWLASANVKFVASVSECISPAAPDRIDRWRKLIGIEMEAYGVRLACKSSITPPPEFHCLKSICDFATDEKDDWQD